MVTKTSSGHQHRNGCILLTKVSSNGHSQSILRKNQTRSRRAKASRRASTAASPDRTLLSPSRSGPGRSTTATSVGGNVFVFPVKTYCFAKTGSGRTSEKLKKGGVFHRRRSLQSWRGGGVGKHNLGDDWYANHSTRVSYELLQQLWTC